MNRLVSITMLGLLVTVLLGGQTATAHRQNTLAGKVIVLDAGHGGDDWGVDPAGSKQREKDVVLRISEYLRDQLEDQGATVYLTREQDRFISLGARVRFANAVLFRPDNDTEAGRTVSLHLNSNRENPWPGAGRGTGRSGSRGAATRHQHGTRVGGGDAGWLWLS